MKKMVLIALGLAMVGCKSPFDRAKDASEGGATGTISSMSTFVIFSDELKSGGGAFEYPGADGQSLAFNDTSNPISRRSIRYSWSGVPVTNLGCPAQNPTHNFAGFDLMHVPDNTPDLSVYKSTPGRDLTQGGKGNYGKVTFYARGSLSTNNYIKVEVANPASTDACVAVVSPCLKLIESGQTDPAPTQDATCSPLTITDAWSQYTIILPTTWLGTHAVKDFFKSTFVFVDPFVGSTQSGQGGVVYYDKIQYEQ